MFPVADASWFGGGSMALVCVGCLLVGCESVSDAPSPPPAPARPSVAATAQSATKVEAAAGPKPLVGVTAAELKELAKQLDLLIYGWSSDQRETTRPGYRNTTLSGRDSVGTSLSIWLRCEPDADKWAELLAAEGQRPEGQAAAIEGNCGLWVRAEGQGHHKRTDVAERLLESIQRLRARK